MKDLKDLTEEIKKLQADTVDKQVAEEEAIACIQKSDQLKDDVVKYNDDINKQFVKVKEFYELFDDVKDWVPALEKKMADYDAMSAQTVDVKEKEKKLDVCLPFDWLKITSLRI